MLNHKPKGAGPKSQVSILGTLCAVCADKGERQASSEILPPGFSRQGLSLTLESAD